MRPLVLMCLVLAALAIATGWQAARSAGRSQADFRRSDTAEARFKSTLGSLLSLPEIEADRIHSSCRLSAFSGDCFICIGEGSIVTRASDLVVLANSSPLVVEVGDVATRTEFDELGPGGVCAELRRSEAPAVASPDCGPGIDCPLQLDPRQKRKRRVTVQVRGAGGLMRLRCLGSCRARFEPVETD